MERLLAGASRHELPVIVIGEYRYGLAGSKARRTLLPLLEELIRESIILEVGLATADVYAMVRARLRKAGHPLPENDVWIAALALEHRLEIASRDAHFDVVEGIRRRTW